MTIFSRIQKIKYILIYFSMVKRRFWSIEDCGDLKVRIKPGHLPQLSKLLSIYVTWRVGHTDFYSKIQIP